MKPKKSTKKTSGASRFVLMAGDEGAILIKIQNGGVVQRVFSAAPDDAGLKNFETALSSSPKSPITILFDLVDQSYVRQTLPPVSSMNVGKIINRRLVKDFAPDDIKGYLILGRENTGRKDWNYLMVSLANSPILQKWISFVAERPNPFKGIGLIPLESQEFIKALDEAFIKNSPKNTKPLDWHILISHNKVGGFRQIVTRGGKLIFTRMAQSVGESSPDVIAGNIEQELINTLEYLKRLGLQDPSLICTTIICSEEIKQCIATGNIKTGEQHILTPFETTKLLSLKDTAKPEDQFGDVVLSAFIAKRKKLILTLNTPYTSKIISLYSKIKYIKIFRIMLVLSILAWIGVILYGIINEQSEVEVIDAKHNKLTQNLEELKKESANPPKNIEYYIDIMTIVRMLNKKQYDTGLLIERISKALENSALVSNIEIVLLEPMKVTLNEDKRQLKITMDLNLTIPKEPREEFINGTKKLIERVKKEFPEYNVTFSDILGVTSEATDLKSIIGSDGDIKYDSVDSKSEIKPLQLVMTGPKDDKKIAK